MFIPPANEPLEMSKWRRWVNDREADQEKLNAEIRAFMAKSGKEISTGARQTSVVNILANRHTRDLEGIRGLPEGDAERRVLRTTDSAEPYWSGELIDQRVTYFIGLGTVTSYVDTYAGNSNSSVVVPAPDIYGGGKNLNWLLNADGDAFPVHLDLLLFPESDLDEFHISLPSSDNDFGGTAPFWSLLLHNASDTNRARVFLSNGLMYEGTNVPVMGDTDQWDLDPMFEAIWTVTNGHRAWRANTVTPMSVAVNSDLEGPAMVMDKFYVENVRGRTNMLTFTAPGTAATGALSQTYYNDTSSTQYITLSRATAGTAPTGADLTVDVKVDGVTEFTTTIAASATTASATPPAQPWPVKRDALDPDVDFFAVDWPAGSYVTVDVTQVGSTIAGADLTVQVWAG